MFDRQLYRWWGKRGSLVALQDEHHNIISDYQGKYKVKTLFEMRTGTGDMVYSQRYNFEKIYSIELNRYLYYRAIKKFSAFRHITPLHGDGNIILRLFVPEEKERAIFRFGQDYFGGVIPKLDDPLFEDLDVILASGIEHIILIDGLYEFYKDDSFSFVMKELSRSVREHFADSIIEIQNGIIRIELKNKKNISINTTANTTTANTTTVNTTTVNTNKTNTTYRI